MRPHSCLWGRHNYKLCLLLQGRPALKGCFQFFEICTSNTARRENQPLHSHGKTERRTLYQLPRTFSVTSAQNPVCRFRRNREKKKKITAGALGRINNFHGAAFVSAFVTGARAQCQNRHYSPRSHGSRLFVIFCIGSKQRGDLSRLPPREEQRL